MISLGTIPLNKVSASLRNLPKEARATFLVCPENLSSIDRGAATDTWLNSINRINDIENYYGLHGVGIYDYYPNSPYEDTLADYLREIYEKTKSTNQRITTGLFMPTSLLTNGTRPDIGNPADIKNLFNQRKYIVEQGHDPFKMERNNKDSDLNTYWTCTHHECDYTVLGKGIFKAVNFVGFYEDDRHKGGHLHGVNRYDEDISCATRPVAVTIEP